MSRVFEALRQFELEARDTVRLPGPPPLPTDVLKAEKPPEPGLEQAEIISMNPSGSNHMVALTDESGLGAEKFRVLATRLSNLGGVALKTVQVTSSVIGEGKTLVSCNLAVTLAKRSGKKVLLIEGDLRKPAVCSTLGITPQTGIGEWWCGQERRRRPRPGSTSRNWHPRSVLPHLRHFENSNLWLLAAGAVSHPTPILQSPRLADLMAQLAEWFDWIVVDTPPLIPMADSNLWAKLVDGTLLVVREGIVPRKALQRAVASLDNPKLVGVVLNDAADFERTDYYGDYYGTGARSVPEGREDRR